MQDRILMRTLLLFKLGFSNLAFCWKLVEESTTFFAHSSIQNKSMEFTRIEIRTFLCAEVNTSEYPNKKFRSKRNWHEPTLVLY